jgi:hypothetical protein
MYRHKNEAGWWCRGSGEKPATTIDTRGLL